MRLLPILTVIAVTAGALVLTEIPAQSQTARAITSLSDTTPGLFTSSDSSCAALF